MQMKEKNESNGNKVKTTSENEDSEGGGNIHTDHNENKCRIYSHIYAW